MPRQLFPSSAFLPIAGTETPAIANLQFAAFFGDGSYGPRDGQNLAPGGAAFTVGGTAPAASANYITVRLGAAYLSTAMGDNFDACTIVYAVLPPLAGQSVTYFQFVSSGSDGLIRANYDTGRTPNVSVFTPGGGGPNAGGGACNVDGPDVNHTASFNLFAWVSKVGKPSTHYNLSTGATGTGGTITAAGRTAGHWNIGASAGTFVDNGRIAFALGALTEMSAADLNALAAALRSPLALRGVSV